MSYLILMFLSVKVIAQPSYETIWSHFSPFISTIIDNSENCKWIVLTGSYKGLVLKSKKDKLEFYDTIKVAGYGYFTFDNKFISIDTENKLLFTYRPEEKQTDTINLDFVDFSYGNLLFFNESYIAMNNNSTTNSIIYDVKNKKVEKEFLRSEGFPNDKLVISEDNSFVIGMYAYKLYKYDFIEHSITFNIDIPVIGSGSFKLNKPIDTTVIISNSGYFLSYSTNSGDTIVTQRAATGAFVLLNREANQFYFDDIFLSDSTNFVIYNYLTGERINRSTATENITKFIKIEGQDTLFYSYINRNANSILINTFNYNSKQIDTAFHYSTIDSLLKCTTITPFKYYSIYNDKFLANQNIYYIQNNKQIESNFNPEYNYYKYDNNSLYFSANDSQFIVVDLISKEPIDTILKTSAEKGEDHYQFSHNKKYLISSNYKNLRESKDTIMIYQSGDSEYIEFFDFNNNYILSSKTKSTEYDTEYEIINKIISINDTSVLFEYSFQRPIFSKVSSPVMLKDNSEIAYFMPSDSTIRFRMIQTGEEKSLKVNGIALNLTISEDNKYIAAGIYNNDDSKIQRIEIINFETKELVITIERSFNFVVNYLFSDDLKYLLLFDYDNNIDAIQLNLLSSSIDLLNQDIESLINIYPNPARDLINIKTDIEIDNVSIIDINGQIVNSFNCISTENYSSNIKYLPNGTYFIKVVVGNNIITKKFIIDK